MAEPQPRNLHEGATTGDVEDEVQTTAKSAEDRKAAAAMASLDSRGDDAASSNGVDQEAVSKAMKNLGTKAVEKKEVKKVKVDPADVALLVRFARSKVLFGPAYLRAMPADEGLTMLGR